MSDIIGLKFSIITICRNSVDTLEQCITSVINQTYPYVEYIVVDGGSTDGTLDIIRKYVDDIDRWSSEPDRGIADAMNRGLQHVTGDLVLFLHSDDYFSDTSVLASLAGLLDPKKDIYACNILYGHGSDWQIRKPRGFGWWMNLKTGILHQACACKRDVFEKIGVFDESLSIAMDYDFFLRAYRAGMQVQKIDMVLTNMRDTGIGSLTDRSMLRRRFFEERFVHYKNLDSLLLRLVYFIYWPLYRIYRFIN